MRQVALAVLSLLGAGCTFWSGLGVGQVMLDPAADWKRIAVWLLPLAGTAVLLLARFGIRLHGYATKPDAPSGSAPVGASVPSLFQTKTVPRTQALLGAEAGRLAAAGDLAGARHVIDSEEKLLAGPATGAGP